MDSVAGVDSKRSEVELQMNLVIQVTFSLAVAMTEEGEFFGEQAKVGMLVLLPSRRIITWFHVAKYSLVSPRMIFPGLLASGLTKTSKFSANKTSDTQKHEDVVDAFLDIFYDFPVTVYGSRAAVREISKRNFDSLMRNAVARYNR